MTRQETISFNLLARVVVALGALGAAGSVWAQAELSVRADNSPGKIVQQTGTAGPLTVTTPPTTGTGGDSVGGATANYGFVEIVAKASTTTSASSSLFAGQGTAKFTDSITINAPGRAGTRGRVTFKIRPFGRIYAEGAVSSEVSGASQARATMRFSAAVAGQGKSLAYEIEGNGDDNNYNFLGQEFEVVGEFTFGAPFAVSLELNGTAFAYKRGAQAAEVEIGTSWRGVAEVRELTNNAQVLDYSMSSTSGTNYAQPITAMTPGPQPDSADMIVSVAGMPESVVDGQHVTYRTFVRNAGPSTATGVQGGILGLNAEFVSTTLPKGSYTRVGTALTVHLPDLPGGAETSFDLVLAAVQPVQLNRAQEVSFQAVFTSNGLDAQPESNTATVATEFTGAKPVVPYYLDRVIAPPADFSAANGRFEPAAMNAQRYVAFIYNADSTNPNARRTPLVFKNGNEPFIELTWPGDLNPPAGTTPGIQDISDLDEDGSFWVVGSYLYAGSLTRGVAWKVLPNGTSTVYRLENLYTSVNGNPPSEAPDGNPQSINSSGVAVGYGDRLTGTGTRQTVAIQWSLPATAAQRLSPAGIRLDSTSDVDEAGNVIGIGRSADNTFRGAYYNDQPLPTVDERQILPEALANGRVTGHYDFLDADGPGGPFVYTFGESALRRLPKPADANGLTDADSTGDTGEYINDAGDIVGRAGHLGSVFNPGNIVLWKRRADGTYRVHTLQSILQQTGKSLSSYPTPRAHGIAADGTILVSFGESGKRRTFLLRPGERPTNQPLNISTRMRVNSGDNVLIGGMIVTGVEPKTVVLRAIGPSLSASGVAGALEDPTLELYENNVRVSLNDDWRTLGGEFEPGAVAAGFAPRDDRESALVATLTPGKSYTAVVRGKGGTEGIGLVEAYDLSPGADAQLANISTRGRVETGDNVMIAGFILGGNGSKVLLRALGPSLGAAGVSDALPNPTLQLFDGNGTAIAFNDDWRTGQPDDLPPGFAPPSEAESALVATLGAGPFTAVVRGTEGTGSGVALVEVYDLQ